jgi:hypothetical protein
MTSKTETLLQRLDAIGASLQASGQAQALIALGSVGLERDRLDDWSDLDYFVIAQPGHKAHLVRDLSWLAAAHPLAWSFQNTVDGHKALMTDGVLCEFAVFEVHELDHTPYTPGRLVWASPGVDSRIATPRTPLPSTTLPREEWIVGEALSNVFVGLQRWHRGEKLSAARFVQSHAVDRLIELDMLRNPAPTTAAPADAFNRERRLEFRQPALAAELPALVAGYAHTPAAAAAVLAALQRRGAVLNAAMVAHIEALL